MTREEIISGLKFTIDMFMFDPSTGETLTEPRNDMDKTTIDACKGAIELLEQQPCEDAISREDALKALDYDIKSFEFKSGVGRHMNEIANLLNTIYEIQSDNIKALPPVQPKSKTGHWISIDDVMLVFDDFMRGEVDEDETNTFLEMLKDKAEKLKQ